MKRRSTRTRACKQVVDYKDDNDFVKTNEKIEQEDEGESSSKYFKASENLTAEQVIGISDEYMKQLGVGHASLSDSDTDDSDIESPKKLSTLSHKNDKLNNFVKKSKSPEREKTLTLEKKSTPISPVAKIAEKMKMIEKPPEAVVSKLVSKMKAIKSESNFDSDADGKSTSAKKVKTKGKRQRNKDTESKSNEMQVKVESDVVDSSDIMDFEVGGKSLRSPEIPKEKSNRSKGKEKIKKPIKATRSKSNNTQSSDKDEEEEKSHNKKSKRNAGKMKSKRDDPVDNETTENIEDTLVESRDEEDKKVVKKKTKKTSTKSKVKSEPVVELERSDSSSDESDWEEVAEIPDKSTKNQIPDAPVQITLEATNIMKKKKKNGCDLRTVLQRQVNKYQKCLREEMHKVHLLCLVSAGMYLNRVCLDETLMAVALSCCPEKFCKTPASKWKYDNLKEFHQWLSMEYQEDFQYKSQHSNIVDDLTECLASKTTSPKYLIMQFIIFLRCLGFKVRLISSLQPIPLKAPKAPKPKKKPEPSLSHSKQTVKDEKSELPAEEEKKEMLLDLEKETGSRINHVSVDAKETDKKGKSKNTISKSASKKKTTGNTKTSGKNSSTRNTGRRKCKDAVQRRYASQCGNDESEIDDGDDDDDDDFEEVNDSGKPNKTRNRSNRRKSFQDSDVEIISSHSPAAPRNRRILSSDSGASVETVSSAKLSSATTLEAKRKLIQKKYGYMWAEVFFECEKKWRPIPCHAEVNPFEFAKDSVEPFCYILGIDDEGSMKDLTVRYDSNYMTTTKKLRVDSDWWNSTLEPYKSKNLARDKAEDKELKDILMMAPLPKTLSEYKNHPLYVLERHLLKFEAIYPETSVPLGYFRKEPVYARECVHELHARVQWLKNARVVSVGEKPYKIVKGRKTKKRAYETEEEASLECFGLWQTELYVPPPAVDGKVPRNEFGNVELFQPSMLPPGTVHLKLPGLNKIAKKLEIDCAQAMTGWDFHGGWSHPVMDGFVVCEEFKDILYAAWDEEQEILMEKERQKKEKRVLGNWKLLVRGLQIREHLKKKYSTQEPDFEEPQEKKVKKDDKSDNKKKATDAAQSWPRMRQKDKKDLQLSKTNCFPFEQM